MLCTREVGRWRREGEEGREREGGGRGRERSLLFCAAITPSAKRHSTIDHAIHCPALLVSSTLVSSPFLLPCLLIIDSTNLLSPPSISSPPLPSPQRFFTASFRSLTDLRSTRTNTYTDGHHRAWAICLQRRYVHHPYGHSPQYPPHPFCHLTAHYVCSCYLYHPPLLLLFL